MWDSDFLKVLLEAWSSHPLFQHPVCAHCCPHLAPSWLAGRVLREQLLSQGCEHFGSLLECFPCLSCQQSTLGQLAVPWITVKRQSQRQWLFKAKHGNSSAPAQPRPVSPWEASTSLWERETMDGTAHGFSQAEQGAGPCPEPCPGDSMAAGLGSASGNLLLGQARPPHLQRVPNA